MNDAERMRLFSLFDGKPGYACEIGAADGVFESPTLALEQAGWKVLCVEPNPIFAAKCRAERALVEECAVADFSAGNVEFTLCNVDHNCRLHEMQGGSALTEFYDRAELERLGWSPRGEHTIRVRVRTVWELMFAYEFPRLDFISIDVEGAEDAVLRGMLRDRAPKWAPRVICVENWPGVNKTDRILLPLGYKKIERVTGNYTDWYAL